MYMHILLSVLILVCFYALHLNLLHEYTCLELSNECNSNLMKHFLLQTPNLIFGIHKLSIYVSVSGLNCGFVLTLISVVSGITDLITTGSKKYSFLESYPSSEPER